MEEVALETTTEAKTDNLKRRHSHQPQKRKYRISTRRGRRKTCPEIFSPNTDNDEENEEKALQYQKLADEHFMLGNHDTASSYYSALLDRDFRKSFNNNQAEIDLNNNDVFTNEEEKDRIWAIEYLDLKIIEVNEKISISPTDPEGYLEKAAVFFFRDRWQEAREVLDAGLLKCTKKALIKTTLGNLNKLEKAYEKYCK